MAIKIGSKDLIRDINKKLVLEKIIANPPISRATLSKELGLSKATISSIVQGLIDSRLVLEIGSGDSPLGRKPTMLTLYSHSGFAGCVDITASELHIMLTDLNGKPVFTTRQKYTKSHIPSLGSLISGIFLDLKNIYDSSFYGIIGVTLGIHGVVKENMIVFTPYYDLSAAKLSENISEALHTPVYLLNSSNLAVLGENVFLEKVENIAVIGVKTGIGLGMVLNGKLYTGFNGYAGELGHTIIELGGRQCPCGNRGCLEQYASERVLMLELGAKKGIEDMDFSAFSNLFSENDPDAIYIMAQFIKYISAGINNLLNLYNPEVILINSNFTDRFPCILDDIKSRLTSKTNFVKNVSLSRLKDDAILFGCAYIDIINFLHIDNFDPQRRA